jgi:hypothetical protein
MSFFFNFFSPSHHPLNSIQLYQAGSPAKVKLHLDISMPESERNHVYIPIKLWTLVWLIRMATGIRYSDMVIGMHGYLCVCVCVCVSELTWALNLNRLHDAILSVSMIASKETFFSTCKYLYERICFVCVCVCVCVLYLLRPTAAPELQPSTSVAVPDLAAAGDAPSVGGTTTSPGPTPSSTTGAAPSKSPTTASATAGVYLSVGLSICLSWHAFCHTLC